MKYALVLNDMRESNVENIHAVKISTNKQELVDWYNAQKVEPYHDGRWGKTFKQGSELEWFNPVYDLNIENDYWGGIYTFTDQASDEEIMQFNLRKM